MLVKILCSYLKTLKLSNIKYKKCLELRKYLTKENNLWHFGLFNAKKESDMRKEFKRKYEKLGMGVDHIKSNVNEVQLEFEGKEFITDPIKFMKYISNKRK